MGASERSVTIKTEIKERVSNGSNAQIDEITARECTSDRFHGVQINIYGPIVPVRPIVDFVAGQESLGIESLYHCTDAEEPHLGMFIAYLPEQPNPAFI